MYGGSGGMEFDAHFFIIPYIIEILSRQQYYGEDGTLWEEFVTGRAHTL